MDTCNINQTVHMYCWLYWLKSSLQEPLAAMTHLRKPASDEHFSHALRNAGWVKSLSAGGSSAME